jgi:hypothetical protein
VARHDGYLGHSTFSEVVDFSANVLTGIQDVGGLVVLDAATLSGVVSGRSGSTGQLVLVEQHGPNLVATALYNQPNSDLAGVGYSKTLARLYVYDVDAGRVSWAPYVKGQTSIVPGQWIVLADSASTPELADPGLLRSGSLRVDDGAVPKVVIEPLDWWGGHPTVTLEDRTTGPVISITVPPPSPPDFKIKSHLVPNTTTVEVTGPPGLQVDIVRPDLATPLLIGSGTIGTNGVGAISTSPLAWGAIYACRTAAGEIHGPYRSPGLAFGTSDSTPIGPMSTLRDHVPAQMAFLGHSHFQIPVRIDVDPALVTPPVIYPAILTVGLYGVSTVIPWPSAANSGRVVLAGLADIISDVRYDDEAVLPIGSVKLPLPADSQNLAGAILLFQWIVVFGESDYRVTDVIGYMVRDTVWVPESSRWLLSPFGEAIGAGGSEYRFGANTVAPQLRPRRPCITAVERCLDSVGAVRLSQAALRERLRLLAR